MFDTMTLTKAVGALCGTLLVLMLGGWAAELIYHTGPKGHGDDHAQQAYVIEVEDSGDAGAADESGPSLEELLASADAGKGARVFNKCKACHKLEDGANGTGPHLYAVVDRPVDAVDGYSYSGALEAVADVWSAENLDAFLANPKGYAPGTKMSFSGLKKAEDRANLIAYLETIGD